MFPGYGMREMNYNLKDIFEESGGISRGICLQTDKNRYFVLQKMKHFVIFKKIVYSLM